MSRVYWIKHNGKEILFSDYANLSADEIVAASIDADAEIFPTCSHLPEGSILALVDVSNAVASKAGIAALKSSAKLWRPFYKKQAVIGLTPFHRVFLNAVNKFSGGNFISFNSKDDALAWLTED